MDRSLNNKTERLISKDKAIELIKEVKHNLFLVKSMLYIRDEDALVEKINLDIQKCDKAIKELEK